MRRFASPSGQGDEAQWASPDPRRESLVQRDLVREFVAGPLMAAMITAVLACLLGGLWFAVPLALRRERP